MGREANRITEIEDNMKDIDSSLDVAWEAYKLCDEKKVSREWAENQIERAIGAVSWVAFRMVKDFGSSREWAEKQIERGIGDVAGAAYLMCCECRSSREWTEKQIERGIGDVAIAAYCMVRDCGSSREWAQKQIEEFDLENDGFVEKAKDLVEEIEINPMIFTSPSGDKITMIVKMKKGED